MGVDLNLVVLNVPTCDCRSIYRSAGYEKRRRKTPFTSTVSSVVHNRSNSRKSGISGNWRLAQSISSRLSGDIFTSKRTHTLDCKTNEITAIPLFIKQMSVEGVIFAFDAISTQKKRMQSRCRRRRIEDGFLSVRCTKQLHKPLLTAITTTSAHLKVINRDYSML